MPNDSDECIDSFSGKSRRACRWMTDRGLDWLGRLIIEPRRFVLSYASLWTLAQSLPKGLS